MTDPAYGRFRPALWWAGVRDRLGGRTHRARARWGRLRAPAGDGPLVWLRTGAAREDVQVAVALMQALREAREDTRLVLTYHEEYRDLLEAGLRGMQRMGFGFGPCDARRAVRRVLRRWSPRAVITVGPPAPRNLARALARARVPLVAYAAAGEAPGEVFPLEDGDPLTLLTPAQVEPTLRGLLLAGGGDGLFWWHGPAEAALLQQWRQRWPQGILALSGDSAAWRRRLAGVPHVLMSDWDRDRAPLPPGTVLVVDEPRWYPALAASAHVVHLAAVERALGWQVLAGGRPASWGGRAPVPLAALLAAWAPPRPESVQAVLAQWAQWQADPFAARQLGDAARRLFWDHRRRAAAALDRLRARYRTW